MKPVVTLRPPREGDAAIHCAHPPEAETVRMYGGDPENLPRLSMTRSQNWYTWLASHRFGRIILADGEPVGEIRLHSVNDNDRSGFLALGLFSSRYHNKGIGRQAIGQTLKTAFQDHQLARIDLRVFAFNGPGIWCYQACGFAHVMSEMIDIAGKPQEEWTMSCHASQ